jgi:hypothetical protein
VKTRTYLDVRFDVTLLNEDERATLCGDVCVQHEPVDYEEPDEHGYVRGHHGVPYPEIEWNEVEIDDPIYDWIGWEEGEELNPPEPGKRWLTITEDGEEMAIIVHRHTGRNDGELMTQKIRDAQAIVAALNQQARS